MRDLVLASAFDSCSTPSPAETRVAIIGIDPSDRVLFMAADRRRLVDRVLERGTLCFRASSFRVVRS